MVSTGLFRQYSLTKNQNKKICFDISAKLIIDTKAQVPVQIWYLAPLL